MSARLSLHREKDGALLIQIMVFGAIATFLISGFVAWAGSSFRAARLTVIREQAFHIAESGLEYYRWHLAHAPADYADGTGLPGGTYNHTVSDKDGNVVGTFSLTITAPSASNAKVVITSKGWTAAYPSLTRTLEATLAIPSWAKYAWVLNDVVVFGQTSEVFGPVHSNNGIRFDGKAHNLVTSARATYVDPSGGHAGGPQEFGVHTHRSPVDPLPPASVPSRPDVFEAGRQFPVPAIDFNALTANLSQLKTLAQSGGSYFAASGGLGYHAILNSNGTFDVHRVNSLVAPPGGCSAGGQVGWGTWSINPAGSSETFLGNYPYPANGIMFFEDHLWVGGTIDNARLTLAAGRFPDSPTQRKNIIVNADVRYTNYDGRDVVGLIAQNSVLVGLKSANDLRIDAAMISQNGKVGRFSYSVNCGAEYRRNNLTTYGMLGSFLTPTFFFSTNGYMGARTYTYDPELLYNPPPGFPLASDQYSVIAWEEK